MKIETLICVDLLIASSQDLLFIYDKWCSAFPLAEVLDNERLFFDCLRKEQYDRFYQKISSNNFFLEKVDFAEGIELAMSVECNWRRRNTLPCANFLPLAECLELSTGDNDFDAKKSKMYFDMLFYSASSEMHTRNIKSYPRRCLMNYSW